MIEVSLQQIIWGAAALYVLSQFPVAKYIGRFVSFAVQLFRNAQDVVDDVRDEVSDAFDRTPDQANPLRVLNPEDKPELYREFLLQEVPEEHRPYVETWFKKQLPKKVTR